MRSPARAHELVQRAPLYRARPAPVSIIRQAARLFRRPPCKPFNGFGRRLHAKMLVAPGSIDARACAVASPWVAGGSENCCPRRAIDHFSRDRLFRFRFVSKTGTSFNSAKASTTLAHAAPARHPVISFSGCPLPCSALSRSSISSASRRTFSFARSRLGTSVGLSHRAFAETRTRP